MSPSFDLIHGSLLNLDGVRGTLVSSLLLFDQPDGLHALDDATENDILSVKVGEGGSGGNVELRLIRMFKSIAFAHAQKADFGMLDLERFVVELRAGFSGLQLLVLGLDLTHLNEHSLNDAVDF